MLQKYIHYTSEGVIWRICPDDTGRYLIAEIRLPDQKESFFTGIELDSGKSSFERLQLGEKWFNGIEAAAHGSLFLHGYLSGTLPEHRGVFAYDLKTGRNLWNNYNLVFYQLHPEGIIAGNYKTQPRRYYLYNARTGAQGAAADLRTASFYEPPVLPLFPEKRSLASAPFAPFSGIKFPGQLMDEAEYLPVQDHDVFSVYEKGKEGFLNHILVFDRNPGDSGPVHTDILADGIRSPVWGTFFVLNGQLIYIRNKKELLGYSVNGS